MMDESALADVVVHSRTDRETVRFTLKWTIDKVRSLKNRKNKMYGDGITMKELGTGDTYQGRWRICLWPSVIPANKRYRSKKESMLFAFLKLSDEQSDQYTSGKDVDIRVTSSMLTGKALDSTLVAKTEEHTFSANEGSVVWPGKCYVSHRNLFGADKDAGLLKDDCITITMDVLMYKEPEMSRTTVHFMSAAERCHRFLQRQAHFRSSVQSTDFVLQSSDDKDFSINQYLLMAHSPVFAAMMTHDTKEKQTSRCELTDIDGESVELLLEYVYGCEIGNISEKNAEKVLIAADKYQITDLRAVCEGILANSVSADNAIHCLVLSSQRDLTTLKEAALKVIPKNLGTVLRSLGMEETMQSDPELIRTVMQHCSKKMRVVEESE